MIQAIGFARVFTIHVQRLWMISSSAGSGLVCFQSSLSLITLAYRVQRIFLLRVLLNVWIFLGVTAVVLHAFAPYSRTDFTVMLKILILMLMVRLGECYGGCADCCVVLDDVALASVDPQTVTC